MLTTDDCMTLNDYVFKSSPESCYSNSSSADYTDLPSDEDFLQHLSSDLNIPLLLNPGEDEMSLLNSIFDKTPEEIMSESVSPSNQDRKFDDIAEEFNDLEQLNLLKWGQDAFPNLQSDIKAEPFDSCSSSDSNKSNSPVQSPIGTGLYEIKDEFKFENTTPPHVSHDSKRFILSSIPNENGNIRNASVVNGSKIVPKRVPIQPKTPYTVPLPKNKVVLIKSPEYKLNSHIENTVQPKVVVLENIAAVPITTASVTPLSPINPSPVKNCITTNVSPVILSGNNALPINVRNIDPKILKRQQRKIKNRESACLSRKKKKDYLTSLENQVKVLSKENQILKTQNLHLKEKLAKYEGSSLTPNISSNNVKNTIVLCMFIFSLSFNLDYIKGPFISKSSTAVARNDYPADLSHHGRNLLWTDDTSDSSNNTNFLPLTMCPAAINQSESARLVLELERWIGKPKMTDIKPTEAANTKLNITNTRAKPLRKKKQKKNQNPIVSSMYSMSQKLPQAGNNNEIQVFSPTLEQMYSEFFEAINRQDDTFYVVSLSDHHMLLPALHHNKTRRPKMSLIMPSMLPSGNVSKPALVPLMQIDCEVLDTRLIQIRRGLIPQHLRNQGNSTQFEDNSENDMSKSGDTAANYTRKKAYKPYFIKQNSVRSNDDFYNIR